MVVLTADDVEKYKYTFTEFDTNNDGKISVTELQAAIKSVGKRPSYNEVKEMISRVDRNGDDSVCFDEFLAMMINKYHRENDPETQKRAFKLFDKDNDGYITQPEYNLLLQAIGDHLDDFFLEDTFEKYDKSQDGKINFEEFQEMFKNMKGI